MPLLHREPGTTGQHLLQRAAIRQPPHPVGAHPAGYRHIEVVHHRADLWLELLAAQLTADQEPHPAGDVEADPAGGNDPTLVDVGGRHAADRKPVSQCTSGIA